MLNRKKVQLMTKLARYEKQEEKRYLKIGRYYRSDYIGIVLLKNFFATTAAYLIIIGMIFIGNIDAITEEFSDAKIRILLLEAAAGYLILLAVYSGITYTIASIRYAKARKSIASYEAALGRLEKAYDRGEEEKRSLKKAGGDGK